MLAGLLAALCFAPHVQAQQIFAPNMGAAEQPTGDRSYREAVDFGGHGVVLATGNKIETDVDFAAQGEMALYLQRTYNHHWTAAGLFGRHWLSNFDYSLAASTVAGQEILWVQRPDGRRIKFVPSGQAARWNEDKPSPIAYVVRNGDGTYTLRNEERGTEKYGSDGRISERRNEHGIAWTFSYAGDYLSRVTHSSGAFVEFEWSGAQLVRAWDPARRAYNYSYTNDAFGPGRHRLAGVQLPGLPTTAVGYHYEDSRFPGGLTGKSYNATRYSTVEYDANGRVFATMLAGGVERYEFTYTGGSETPIAPPPLPPAPGDEGGGGGWCEYQSGSRICFQPRFAAHGASGVMASMGGLAFGSVGAATAFAIASSAPFSVTEKNPHGKQIVYQFENDRLVSVSRLGSAKSPPAYRERQYDVNGYEQFVSNFVDGLTGYVYDAHGHLLSSTEGSGTPTPRATVYAWDENANRVTSVTVMNLNQTTYAYTPDGRVDRVEVKNLSNKGIPNAVLATQFTYTKHANGLVATVVEDGPVPGDADAITSSFDAAGNLISVTNKLGHRTTYGAYNAMGQVGRVEDPNGDVIEYVYDGRGRVSVAKPIVNGAAQATTYTYDGFGRLASTQTPDGRVLHRVYDAAWRVIEEYEREPGGTYARRIREFDSMSRQTKMEVRRSTFPHDTRIVGNIDGLVPDGGGLAVRGWACTTGQNAPVSVHAYAGGGWPVGTLIGDYGANLPSEAGVAAACGAQGSTYRFQFPLTDAVRDAHGGKMVYVHGISPAGKDNSLIAGSGVYAIPRLLPNAAPTGLTAPARSISSSWSVSWNAIARATRYRLEENTNGGAWTIVHDGAETTKAISGKGAGVYGYRVAGCNETGCGPVSGAVSVERVVAPPTAPNPSGPGVNDVSAFTVSVSPVAGATYYVIDQSANGGAWGQVHNGPATSVYLTGRNTTIDHQYRARACNDAGCGPTSGVITVQRAIYGAQYAGQAVFGLALPGQLHTVTVYMRNTGNTTWSAGNAYSLGSQNPGDNWTWGLPRVAVSGSVPPGATATFTFNVRAPGSTGYHNFQWQMVRDGYAWFGDATPNVVIEVATANVYGNVGRCPLYIGQATCSIVVNWTSTRSDAQLWVSNTDGSNWQLVSPQRSGSLNVPWISLTPKRFYVMAAGVALASIDLEAYQLNEYPPDPDPPGGCVPNPPIYTCDPL